MPTHESVLLRRHICKRLSDYFSQPSNDVVGSVAYGAASGINSCEAAKVMCIDQSTVKPRHKEAINFASLMGEWHWKRSYERIYKEQQGMWLTPSELFTPYYSNILANFVSSSMKYSLEQNNDGEFAYDIVELGGGRGTNASALLNYLHNKHPDMYECLDNYTIFDTSPTLHNLQREFLVSGSDNETKIHADKIKLVNVDLMNIAEGISPFLLASSKPTFVIALEVLDNLPHDKIMRCARSREVLQAEVIPFEASHGSETFRTLNDKLLEEILSRAPELYVPKVFEEPRWIPTVALGILLKLFECRPNSSIAFADFDWLPLPDVKSSIGIARSAMNDPLVTDMHGQDHTCYLSSPADVLCDILFPTDFDNLASFIKRIDHDNKFSVLYMKQHEFLLKHGTEEVEQTKSWLTGYSPLIHDFGNCSVLEVTRQK